MQKLAEKIRSIEIFFLDGRIKTIAGPEREVEKRGVLELIEKRGFRRASRILAGEQCKIRINF